MEGDVVRGRKFKEGVNLWVGEGYRFYFLILSYLRYVRMSIFRELG